MRDSFKNLVTKIFGVQEDKLAEPMPVASVKSPIRKELQWDPYEQEDGSYHFDLSVIDAGNGMLSIECDLKGFSIAVETKSDLFPVSYMEDAIRISVSMNFDMDVDVYFGNKSSEYIISGKDECLALPVGIGHTLIVVPQDKGFELETQPKNMVPKGSCPVHKSAF